MSSQKVKHEMHQLLTAYKLIVSGTTIGCGVMGFARGLRVGIEDNENDPDISTRLAFTILETISEGAIGVSHGLLFGVTFPISLPLLIYFKHNDEMKLSRLRGDTNIK